jgi:hypothetical protein
MVISEAIKYMKENPFVKVTMPQHYKSWQYNYYDDKQDKILIENGKDEWDIELSKSYNEMDGYELYKGK